MARYEGQRFYHPECYVTVFGEDAAKYATDISIKRGDLNADGTVPQCAHCVTSIPYQSRAVVTFDRSAEPERDAPLTVRFPPQLLDALRAAAKADRRSLNAEIVWMLDKAIGE